MLDVLRIDAGDVGRRPDNNTKMLGQHARIERRDWVQAQLSPVAPSCILAPCLKSATKRNRHPISLCTLRPCCLCGEDHTCESRGCFRRSRLLPAEMDMGNAR